MKHLLLYLLLICSISTIAQELSEGDRDALIALYNSTNGAEWTTTWDLNDTPQNWYGVETRVYSGSSGTVRLVKEINLSNNNLTGTLPAQLGDLEDLNTLDLSANSISGAIPNELGNASTLNYLYLQENLLSGSIPTQLFSLSERHFLDINLSNNKLTGSLPDVGNSYANAGSLKVSNNLLTDLPNYTYISLFFIETLDISANNIYFSVFERVSNGVDTIAEVLEDNVANLTYAPQNRIDEQLSSTIDEGASYTMFITGLTSNNNTYQWFKDGIAIAGATATSYQITSATITDQGVYTCEVNNPEIPNLTLERNPITLNVTLPVNDRNSLIALYNATDGANWTNPWDLNANIDTWEGVTVNGNGDVIGLSLSFRNLNGTLPAELGNLSQLKQLSIFGNPSANLTGSLPETICNLQRLSYFNIAQTKLTGEIPTCLFLIPTLENVRISGRSPLFTLNLPDDLSALTNLKRLYLQRVDLSSEGAFPLGILELENIEDLTLDITRLSGPLPAEIGTLNKLRALRISSNNTTGEIPKEINLLTGLKSLELVNNNLSGPIPSELGSMENLEDLFLDGNAIEGQIPASFANLTNLRKLSLTRNRLSGVIPEFINSFDYLYILNIRENNFSGSLPLLNNLWENVNNFSGTLSMEDNGFVFEDFEDDFNLYTTNLNRYSYSPQSKVDMEETIYTNLGQEITLTVEATQSVNNTYQWRKDGVNIAGATGRTYTISSIDQADNGIYDCLISNSVITDLVLQRNTITLIQDATNPEITCPEDITIDCAAIVEPSNTGFATATDDVDDSPEISYTDMIENGVGSNVIITRSWTATDGNGNTAVCEQIITLEDSIAPNISCPNDITLSCNESVDPSITGTVETTDNCDSAVQIAYTDSVTSTTGSNSTIVRTWIATDANGNSNTCSQTITLVDNMAPSLSCPNDITLSCNESIDPSIIGTAEATDNCDSIPQITYADSITATIGSNVTIARTWTATDINGNTASCVQMIVTEDTVAPEITCPTTDNVLETFPDLTSETTTTDNCSTTITVTQDPAPGTVFNLDETVTVTLTATDENNNSSTCTFDVTVVSTLSTEDSHFEKGIKLYPNPTENIIYIQSETTLLTKIVISDINGRIVKTLAIDEAKETQISLIDQSSGVYFAQIISKNSSTVKRLIKL